MSASERERRRRRPAPIRLATRGSALALAQARAVGDLLGEAELVEAAADSSELGDKSRFVRGVERALLEGRAEIGVHSAKDVPAEGSEGLRLAGVPARENAADAWIGAGSSLAEVSEGARVGTSSLRRRSQLLARRPDLEVRELRGNVDTRLGRLAAGELDAIVLAVAGLRRLGREGEVAFELPVGEMTPAAGQGALALQVRADDPMSAEAAASITDSAALVELTAERAAVSALDATCATPVGVHADQDGDQLLIDGFIGLPDGSEWVRDRLTADPADPPRAGRELAARLLSAGGGELLERAEAW
jgi:hydroxymethylbilane synthase